MLGTIMEDDTKESSGDETTEEPGMNEPTTDYERFLENIRTRWPGVYHHRPSLENESSETATILSADTGKRSRLWHVDIFGRSESELPQSGSQRPQEQRTPAVQLPLRNVACYHPACDPLTKEEALR